MSKKVPSEVHDFNWIIRRLACTNEAMFKMLCDAAVEDVEKFKKAFPNREISVERCEKGEYLVIGDPKHDYRYNSYICYKLDIDGKHISVRTGRKASGEHPEVEFMAKLSAECEIMLVDKEGKEHRIWQVNKRFLEPFLFRGQKI